MDVAALPKEVKEQLAELELELSEGNQRTPRRLTSLHTAGLI